MLHRPSQIDQPYSSWALEQPDVLVDINDALVTQRDRSSLFGAVTAALGRIVDFDCASLTLLDSTKEDIVLHALAGRENLTRSFPLRGTLKRRGSHLEKVLTEGLPVIRRDLLSGRLIGFERNLKNFGLRSYVSVPLIRNGSPFGSVNIGSCTYRQFVDGNLPFLMDVARNLSLALDNLLAHEEISVLRRRLAAQNPRLHDANGIDRFSDSILGRSEAIRRVLKHVATAAPTDANILITGETGTGKGLVARAVHEHSPRRERPLVTVNCASIPRDLFESEFFGHVKGSFTGALRDRAGRFELANGSTLFLDEIAEIPYELQGKLLRVLQEGQFERVGDVHTRTVDVRIIAATNRNLIQEIEKRGFRQDLFYRLNIYPIDVPPLRDRKQDIPSLAAYFVQRAARRYGCPEPVLSEREVRKLRNYFWPGNLRELQAIVDRAVISSSGGDLHFELPTSLGATGKSSIDDILRSPRIVTEEEQRVFQRANMLAALDQTRWKIHGPGGAAELLGIAPTTLASRMARLGLKRR